MALEKIRERNRASEQRRIELELEMVVGPFAILEVESCIFLKHWWALKGHRNDGIISVSSVSL